MISKTFKEALNGVKPTEQKAEQVTEQKSKKEGKDVKGSKQMWLKGGLRDNSGRVSSTEPSAKTKQRNNSKCGV